MNTVSFDLYASIVLDSWVMGGFMSLKIFRMWLLLCIILY